MNHGFASLISARHRSTGGIGIDLRPCVPSTIPQVIDVHHVVGPIAAVLLAVAALAWIASVRLEGHGRDGGATVAEVAAVVLAYLGMLGVAVWVLTTTC